MWAANGQDLSDTRPLLGVYGGGGRVRLQCQGVLTQAGAYSEGLIPPLAPVHSLLIRAHTQCDTAET